MTYGVTRAKASIGDALPATSSLYSLRVEVRALGTAPAQVVLSTEVPAEQTDGLAVIWGLERFGKSEGDRVPSPVADMAAATAVRRRIYVSRTVLSPGTSGP